MKYLKLYEELEGFEEVWEEEDDTYRTYISNETGICPVCNSNFLQIDDHDYEGDESIYRYTCGNCGYIGGEYYRLEFNGNIDDFGNDIRIGAPVNLRSFDHNVDEGEFDNYISNDENTCPVCNSENLEYYEMDNDGDDEYRSYRCIDCEFLGVSYMMSKFVSHFILSTGKDIELGGNVDEKQFR